MRVGRAPLQVLVLAKAPVAGRVKTRLGAEVGMDAAARLAGAALTDTLRACAALVGPESCHLALDGDREAVESLDGVDLDGWSVRHQAGGDLGERIAAAFAEIPGPALQIGMDTPQVTPELLREAATGLESRDAVLGEASDGGWWLLGLRDPAAAGPLRDVPMSTPTTYADTRAALVASGLEVAGTVLLRDVDTAADAAIVAGEAPETCFARSWRDGQ